MVHPSHLDQFVSRLNQLVPLSVDHQAALLGLPGKIIQVRANGDVVAPGSEVENAYLVIHGLIARFSQLRSGERQLIVLHVPGDMADLHTVPVPRAITAIEAVTTSTLMSIPLPAIRSLVRERPTVAEALWAYAAVDAAILARWTASVGRQPARGRMAHLLCELGLRMECAGLGHRSDFNLEMTQAQLGDALGLTPVHVNRTLQALRKEGILTTIDRRFIIQQWDELAAIGEFEPDYLVLPADELRAA
jgi:CRP-like cAMP-binding protein